MRQGVSYLIRNREEIIVQARENKRKLFFNLNRINKIREVQHVKKMG